MLTTRVSWFSKGPTALWAQQPTRALAAALVLALSSGSIASAAEIKVLSAVALKVGKIAAGSQATFARAGVGVCGRAGAPKPNIGTVEGFKRALLDAKSVSYSAEGTSGAYFLSLLDRLNIAGEMKDKLKPQPGGMIPNAVAKGEAELCVTVMSQLVPIIAGAQLGGPVPSNLQTYIRFTAGAGSNAKKPEAARDFITYLKGPEVAAMLASYGLEAPAP